MMETAIDATSVELEPAQPRTLFRTDDPAEVLTRARDVAAKFKAALDEGNMVMRIGANEHVLIDGWQTLGSMLGVTAYVVWSRPLEKGEGWEARAEARLADGRVLGAGEAMCTRAEANWKRSDEYAIRGMAQTRAMSRALRAPLGFVVALGGLPTTPAEEMNDKPAGLPEWAEAVDDAAIDRFGENLTAILEAAGVTVEPAAVAGAVGDRLVRFTDGTIPAACASLAHHLARAIEEITKAAAKTEAEQEGSP